MCYSKARCLKQSSPLHFLIEQGQQIELQKLKRSSAWKTLNSLEKIVPKIKDKKYLQYTKGREIGQEQGSNRQIEFQAIWVKYLKKLF